MIRPRINPAGLVANSYLTDSILRKTTKIMEAFYLVALMNVNAFDQPKVEEYKKAIRWKK